MQGPIHFATINTDQKLDAGSEQRSWLEADLAAVDRNITPWVVINLHRPLYNDGALPHAGRHIIWACSALAVHTPTLPCTDL